MCGVAGIAPRRTASATRTMAPATRATRERVRPIGKGPGAAPLPITVVMMVFTHHERCGVAPVRQAIFILPRRNEHANSKHEHRLPLRTRAAHRTRRRQARDVCVGPSVSAHGL